MSYVVLARKWRPQTFDDLTGQDHVTRTLTNAIEQNRVPHAMLFTGARGVGKTSSARIVAMALNCARGPTPSPCGVCDSCREVQKGSSVDVFEIDGASNRGINEIRDLRDGVRYAPNRDRYKIYIIDEVHMLTTEAFNALLKTLEEPPPHVVFMFATTEAHKIPITILSRCQRFDFRRIPHREIIGRLRHIVDAEKIRVPDDVLALIARQSGGGMRDALSRLDQVIAFCGNDVTVEAAAEVLGVAERQRLFEISEALVVRDVEAALRVIDNVSSFGVDLAQFGAALVSHLRDLTVISVSRDAHELTVLTDAELTQARSQVARIDAATLHRLFEVMLQAADDATRSAHARLVLEMALVRMIAIDPVHSLASLVRQLEKIAAGEGPLPPPTPPSGPATPSNPSTSSSTGAVAIASKPEVLEQATAASAPSEERATEVRPAVEERADEERAVEERAVEERADEERAEDDDAQRQSSLLPPTEPEPAVEPNLPVHLVEPSSAGFDAAAYRGIIERLRGSNRSAAALLAHGTVVSSDGETLVVAVGRGHDWMWTPGHQASFEEAAVALNAPHVTVQIVRSDELDDSDLQEGYQLTREERREREQRAEDIRRRFAEHDATQRIQARWPGTRIIDIEIAELTEESTV